MPPIASRGPGAHRITMVPMTRPVSSPRQMALRQSMQRNVFRKPREEGQKNLPHAPGRDQAPHKPSDDPTDPMIAAEPAHPIQSAGKAEPASAGTMVGRNDPCPCGSGRKFKKCCGR